MLMGRAKAAMVNTRDTTVAGIAPDRPRGHLPTRRRSAQLPAGPNRMRGVGVVDGIARLVAMRWPQIFDALLVGRARGASARMGSPSRA